MTQELASSLAVLVQGVRDGRVALVMDADGMVVASAGGESALAESVAGEYGVILREAKSLCEARGWGALRSFTVQGAELRLVFADLPGDLTLGLSGGPEALVGLMRQAAGSAAPGLGTL
jgi:predicted regulator of Ras-like GTPase activity (Roadblock/LC7/MglB family)